MKVGKRIISILLVVLLLSTLAACGNSTANPSTKPSANPSASPSANDSKPTVKISLAHNLAVGSVMDQTANKFAELCAEKSDGRIKVTVYPAAQLGNERDMLEGIQMDTIDMMLATTAYLANLESAFSVLDLPFIFDDVDHVKACLDGEVGQQLSKILSDNQGLKILTYLNSGFRVMLTKNTKLENLDSFKGLQMRSPETPVYVQMFKALGAAPTPIPFSEVYTAIQTGVVEGVEVSPDLMYTMKFHEVGKYIARTNHIFTTVVPLVSNKYWNSLDADTQRIIKEAWAEVAAWEWGEYEGANEVAIGEMAKAGIAVNDIDRASLREACTTVYDEFAKQNSTIADLINKIQGAR